MPTRITIAAAAALTLVLSAFALPHPGHESHAGADTAPAALSSRAAFERLERLEGTWSVVVDGRPGSGPATYRLTGGGRVLVENFGGMMTTYHLDADKLMLTHYCGAGNQPRMRLKEAEGDRLTFEMFDITNLSAPNAYHTTDLEVTFHGEDRVALAYSGMRAGKRSTQVFELTRARASASAR